MLVVPFFVSTLRADTKKLLLYHMFVTMFCVFLLLETPFLNVGSVSPWKKFKEVYS